MVIRPYILGFAHTACSQVHAVCTGKCRHTHWLCYLSEEHTLHQCHHTGSSLRLGPRLSRRRALLFFSSAHTPHLLFELLWLQLRCGPAGKINQLLTLQACSASELELALYKAGHAGRRSGEMEATGCQITKLAQLSSADCFCK